MRLTPWGSAEIHHATGAAVCVWLLTGAFTINSQSVAVAVASAEADGQRTLSDGVYSPAQAARGQQIYRAQCAECHGTRWKGPADHRWPASPFSRSGVRVRCWSWSTRFKRRCRSLRLGHCPGSSPLTSRRTRCKATSFRPADDLSEAVLSRSAFPAAAASPAATAAGASAAASLPPPEGNLAELMRAIAFPNSNIIFNLS